MLRNFGFGSTRVLLTATLILRPLLQIDFQIALYSEDWARAEELDREVSGGRGLHMGMLGDRLV